MMREEWNKKQRDLFHRPEQLRQIKGEFIYALQNNDYDRIEIIAEQLGIMTPNRLKKITDIAMVFLSEEIFLKEQFHALLIELKNIAILEGEEREAELKKITEKFEALLKQIHEAEKDKENKEKMLALVHAKLDQAIKECQEKVKELQEKIGRLEFRLKELDVLEETQIRKLVSTMRRVADDILTGTLIPSDIPVDKEKFHREYLAIVDDFEKGLILLDSIKEKLALAALKSSKAHKPVSREGAGLIADTMFVRFATEISELAETRVAKKDIKRELEETRVELHLTKSSLAELELLKDRVRSDYVMALDLGEIISTSKILTETEHTRTHRTIDEKEPEGDKATKNLGKLASALHAVANNLEAKAAQMEDELKGEVDKSAKSFYEKLISALREKAKDIQVLAESKPIQFDKLFDEKQAEVDTNYNKRLGSALHEIVERIQADKLEVCQHPSVDSDKLSQNLMSFLKDFEGGRIPAHSFDEVFKAAIRNSGKDGKPVNEEIVSDIYAEIGKNVLLALDNKMTPADLKDEAKFERLVSERTRIIGKDLIPRIIAHVEAEQKNKEGIKQDETSPVADRDHVGLDSKDSEHSEEKEKSASEKEHLTTAGKSEHELPEEVPKPDIPEAAIVKENEALILKENKEVKIDKEERKDEAKFEVESDNIREDEEDEEKEKKSSDEAKSPRPW